MNEREKNEKQLKLFWNNCDLHFSHNVIGGHLSNYSTLTKKWESYFIDKVVFKDKTVLDYGIGGGYLGKYLLDNKKIKYYYGVDISERSIQKTSQILKKYNQKKLLNTNIFYDDFKDKVDIFISQACIQHFPTEKYLIEFLKQINSLKLDIVILQIAINMDNTTEFHNKQYNSTSNVVRACYTNEGFLLKYLDNYSIYHKNKKMLNKRKDFLQYLFFKCKND